MLRVQRSPPARERKLVRRYAPLPVHGVHMATVEAPRKERQGAAGRLS